MNQCQNKLFTLNILKLSLRFVVASMLIFSFLISISSCGLFSSLDPDMPKITYGEFPFTLIYEIDGETITIEDTLVIRYRGIGANEGVGKYNKWDRYLKSNGVEGYIRQNVILFRGLLENGNSATIYLELGSCEYYMGLQEDMLYYYYLDIKPGDIVILTHEYNGPINEEDLNSNYGIKIIKVELSLPINAENHSTT